MPHGEAMMDEIAPPRKRLTWSACGRRAEAQKAVVRGQLWPSGGLAVVI
jgi:hypothetical protein